MSSWTRRDLLRAGLIAPLAMALPLQAAEPPVCGGWREALLIVPDAAPWIETLTVVGGWEVVTRGRRDRSLNALWNLPTEASTQQTLLRNIGTRSGYIRLIEVSGVPQQRIRPHDQAWETGGISALDLRVLDMDRTRRELEVRGWNAPSEPIRYTTYGFEVIQWAPRSPDGIRIAFVQRLSPPLQGWDELKRWSRATNIAILTRDIAASEGFYTTALGLTQYSRSNTVGEGGQNVMGLPWRFNESLTTDIRGYNGLPAGDGAVELIAMPQAEGVDHGEHSHPPNLGLAGLRFAVTDAAAVARRLAAALPSASVTPVQTVAVAPYGRQVMLAARAPDGVWLEFMSTEKRIPS